MDPLYIAVPIIVLVLIIALSMLSARRKRTFDGPAKLLQPEAFCSRVRNEVVGAVIITHVGRPSLTPDSGRRFEFKAKNKEGELFRTYFDDASENGSGIPSMPPPSAGARSATHYMRLIMKYATWHIDRRKASLLNPTKYIGRPAKQGTMYPEE